MRWFGTLALLAAVAYSGRAEQSASSGNSISRPIGVVYLLELVSAPRETAPVFDEDISNVIPESTIDSQKHTYLLIRPFSKGGAESPADVAPYQENYRAVSPKYLVRQRRGTYGGKSGGGGFGGGGGGGVGGGGGFGGGGGLGGGGGKGGGLGGGGGSFGGHGGGGGSHGGGGQGGFGGGGHGGGGHGSGGYGGGGSGAHASASASASAKAYGK